MDGIGDTLSYTPARASHLSLAPAALPPWQHTLSAPIGCVGIGLHTGRPVRLHLHPAAPGTGFVFTRTDLAGDGLGQRDGAPLTATLANVIDTTLCTVLGSGNTRIGTVEHLLAALAGAGIDNAAITLDGPELPILDGSARDFGFLIECAGRAEQPVPRTVIEIIRPVRVTSAAGFAELLPLAPTQQPGFTLQASIDFPAAAIGRQGHALTLTPDTFRRELAAARTFTNAAEIEALRDAGLARGGSLENAIVVDGARILNPGGLRMSGEFIRHKLLDVVGDLALAGHPLVGRFVAHRPGHALNSRLLGALLADPTTHRLSTLAPALSVAA